MKNAHGVQVYIRVQRVCFWQNQKTTRFRRIWVKEPLPARHSQKKIQPEKSANPSIVARALSKPDRATWLGWVSFRRKPGNPRSNTYNVHKSPQTP